MANIDAVRSGPDLPEPVVAELGHKRLLFRADKPDHRRVESQDCLIAVIVDTVIIAQLLPHVIASVVDNTVLEQAQNLINDGQPKKQSAPAEGGNLLATLIDIKKAYLKLDVMDKDILIKRYHENLTLQELATYLECATSTADRRCQNSLRRLQNNLGGESPYQ